MDRGRSTELSSISVQIDRASEQTAARGLLEDRASDADEDSTDENGETITHPSVTRHCRSPAGEDYGIEGIDSETGLMDKFLIGDAAAFEVDVGLDDDHQQYGVQPSRSAR